MTDLRTAVDDYLTIRRSLGFKMEANGRLLTPSLHRLCRVGRV
jgi:hypothetical protein